MSEPTKFQRWLDVIAFLISHRLPVTADELLSAIPAYAPRWKSDNPTRQQSIRRVFERDKDELRDLGIPIRTVRYHFNYGMEELEGYQLDRRDFYLPMLKVVAQASGAPSFESRAKPASVEIEQDEAPAALNALRRVARVPGFPLRHEAKSAFRKLAFDLDPEAFDGGVPILFVDRPGAEELSATLRKLTDALVTRKRVAFRYHGIARGEATDRSVDAWGLLFQHGHWYLVGHDHTRGAQRVFRVGRIEAVTVNGERPGTPDYEIPDEFRVESLAGRQAWDFGNPEEAPLVARVRFAFPLSLWAARNGHGVAVETDANGGEVRAFDVRQVNPFLRWILSLEGEAELVEPPELVEALRTMAQAIADAHTARGAR